MYDLLPDRYRHMPVLVRLGDDITPAPYPLLSKARVNGDTNTILMPIEYHRHFNFDFMRLINNIPPIIDIPFSEKKPQAVWRGVTTGSDNWDPLVGDTENYRRVLVETWGLDVSAKVDVGFNKLLQGAEELYVYLCVCLCLFLICSCDAILIYSHT